MSKERVDFCSYEDALNQAYSVFADVVRYYMHRGQDDKTAINNAWIDIEAQCDRFCRDLERGRN